VLQIQLLWVYYNNEKDQEQCQESLFTILLHNITNTRSYLYSISTLVYL
jgi:hypothetical protein